MFNPTRLKKTALAGIFISILISISGCFGGGDSTAPTVDTPITGTTLPTTPTTGDSHLQVSLAVEGVGSLAKTSTLSLNKLVVTLISTARDTISTTLNSTTTPALSPVSTLSQSYTLSFTIPPSRTWRIIAMTLDGKDSIVQLGSSTSFTIAAGATQSLTLNLSPRYVLYQANFLNIPDSISSQTAGTAKQALHIRRLVLMVDGIIAVDSTRQQYFTPNSNALLPFDYLTVGPHTLQLLEYGPMGSWDEKKPLFSGSASFDISSGANISMTLNWVGPGSVSDKVTVLIQKVGTVTVRGLAQTKVLP